MNKENPSEEMPAAPEVDCRELLAPKNPYNFASDEFKADLIEIVKQNPPSPEAVAYFTGRR